MNCKEIQEHMTGYALGMCEASEQAAIATHLETCGDCRVALRDIEPTLEALRDALAVPPDQPLRLDDARRAQVLATRPAAADPAGARRVLGWLTFPHPPLQRLAAVLVIGLLMLSVLVGTFSVNLSGKRKSAMISATRASEAGRRIAEEMDEAELGQEGRENPAQLSYGAYVPDEGSGSAQPRPPNGELDVSKADWESGSAQPRPSKGKLNVGGTVTGGGRENRRGDESFAAGYGYGDDKNGRVASPTDRTRERERMHDLDSFTKAGYGDDKNGRLASRADGRNDLDRLPARETTKPSAPSLPGSGARADYDRPPATAVALQSAVATVSGSSTPLPASPLPESPPPPPPAVMAPPSSSVEGSARLSLEAGKRRQMPKHATGQMNIQLGEGMNMEKPAEAGARVGNIDTEGRDSFARSGGWVGDANVTLDADQATLTHEAFKSEMARPSRPREDKVGDNFYFSADEPSSPAMAGKDKEDSKASMPEEKLTEILLEEFEPGPESVDIDSVALVNSPVVLRGIHSSRTPGARGSALARHAGGGTTESAGSRSLRWLKENQAADGTWNGDVADTSVSLLAYLSHGETPASQEFGGTTEKAIKALLAKQRTDGRFSDDPDVNARATHALNESFGLTRIPIVREAAEKATRALVKDQAAMQELSGWQVRALKSAELAGIADDEVAPATRDAVKKLARSEGAASALGLQLLGQGQAVETRRNLESLKETPFVLSASRLDDMLDITQAKFNAGGEAWNEWNKTFAPTLVKSQTVLPGAGSDGRDLGMLDLSGEAGSEAKSDVYATAMGSLMTQVYYRYLPTYKTPEAEPAESPAGDDIEITILDAPQPVAAVATESESTASQFKAAGVNPVIETAAQPFSTFSIDVDTASYTLARRYLKGGFLPPAESVRTEEFVNFFDYAYRPPENGVFAIQVEGAPSKFGRGQQLLKIGIKGRRLGREESRGAVLTLLVDSSGSMNTPERIELAKKALTMLVERLGPADRVSLIQYDNHARVLLEQAPATEKKAILAAIEGLQCSGSTNLEEGMRRAYQVASAGFVPNAENRVLVLSDGAANLGALSAEDILSQVEAYRKQGILCSVFGLGQGSYNDAMLETLANKGDGVYRFIDSEAEARRVFVDDLAATLHTIARDVKIQVEFNGAVVARYRQLGYENRQLAKEDFRNDAVDAGEVGSGQSVTALYELELQPGQTPGRTDAAAICTVRVRYRRMDNGRVEEVAQPFPLAALGTDFNAADGRFRLAAAVAEAAEILRGSPFAAGSEFERVAEVLRPVALEYHLDGQIQELLRWVQGAGGMSRGQ